MVKKRENEFEKLAKLITVQADKTEEKLEKLITVQSDKTEEKLARLIKSESEDIRKHMATKDQVIALHTQVNSVESQLRGMKHVKLEGRVADLEEKVFGKVRA